MAIEFKKACELRGCPICRLQSKAERRYIDSVLCEHTADPFVLQDFTDSLGYCHLHAWQLALIENRLGGDHLGSASMYSHVLRYNLLGFGELIKSESQRIAMPWLASLHDRFETLVSPRGKTGPVKYPQGIVARKGCRVCKVSYENLERDIFLFGNEGEEEEFLKSYRNSDGLCLPHLRSAIPHIEKLQIRSCLIETVIKRLELLKTEMSAQRESDDVATSYQPVIEWFLGRCKWVSGTGRLQATMEEALSGELCPVCALIPEEVSAYIGRLLMTLEHDVSLCEELTRSRGFCNRHGWQVYDIAKSHSNGRAVSMFYFYLLEFIIPALKETLRFSSLTSAGKTKWWKLPEWMKQEQKVADSGLDRGLKPCVSCPVCRAEADAEHRRIWELVQGLQKPEFRNIYSASPGLCLPHFRHAFMLSNVEGRILLLAKARERAANLLHLLSEYSRKHSLDFCHEPKSPEEESLPVRAVAFEAGEKFQMEVYPSSTSTTES